MLENIILLLVFVVLIVVALVKDFQKETEMGKLNDQIYELDKLNSEIQREKDSLESENQILKHPFKFELGEEVVYKPTNGGVIISKQSYWGSTKWYYVRDGAGEEIKAREHMFKKIKK